MLSPVRYCYRVETVRLPQGTEKIEMPGKRIVAVLGGPVAGDRRAQVLTEEEIHPSRTVGTDDLIPRRKPCTDFHRHGVQGCLEQGCPCAITLKEIIGGHSHDSAQQPAR
jgi:hypothetical protein